MHQRATARHLSKGFTLVELAIVLTIVALLIGGVLKGQELVKNGNMTATLAQVKAIAAAQKMFYDAYMYYPGDMKDARTRLNKCDAAHTCYNGNGNESVNGEGSGNDKGTVQSWQSVIATPTSENFQYWKHLALAGFMKEIDSNASVAKWGSSHPYTALDCGFHAVTTTDAGSVSTLSGNILGFRKDVNGGAGFNCVTPQIASVLDLKADDGVATTGDIQAVSNNWSTGCGTTANGPMGYTESSTTYSCDMMFKLR